MPCSCCTPCPALVVYLACPWSLNVPSHNSRTPSCWAWSRMRVSSGLACGGVLAHLRCSSSSGDDCCLATVWSKCCWRWQSLSLTEVTGRSIRTTDCTGTLPVALACLAWFRISHKSGSFLLHDHSICLKSGGRHPGKEVVPRRVACHSIMCSPNPGYSSLRSRTESSES